MTGADALLMDRKPRHLVVGCGGIGGILAAHLIDLGEDVTILSKNEAIAEAVNRSGLRLFGEGALGRVPARAVTGLEPDAKAFDVIFLATQPPAVEEAARAVVGHLAPDGALVCLPNGLCEPRLAAIVGSERVIGAVVTWGASMVEPGVYDRTSAGGFTLGWLDGPIDERLLRLSHALEAIGPVTVTDNLLGARWSKLAVNCAISSLGTLGGDRLGALLGHRFVRRLALEVMSEAVDVARREGVRLERVSGALDLEWLALTDAERATKLGSPALMTKHALLLAVGARHRRLRSSMLQAIERGREPAVDFLNGEVVAHGARHGVPTPINQAIHTAVWALAKERKAPGLELLEELYIRTRDAATTTQVAAPPEASEPPNERA
jgi:2-dehydropantoate 2-reductase